MVIKRDVWVLLTVLIVLCPVFLRASDEPKPQSTTPSPIAESTPLTPADSLKIVEQNRDFVDLSTIPGIKIDQKYATPDNFMHEVLYGPFTKCFLHKDAAEKFKKAVEILKKEKPGWSFIVFDGLRPRSVQWKMWNRVKDTPQRGFVADANRGSVHNYGFALDISLADEKGKEVDMGTPFDSFSKLAEPKFEQKFMKEGKLTQQQIDNRLILRKIMTEAGFRPIPNEWWHFDGLPQDELEKKYHMIE